MRTITKQINEALMILLTLDLIIVGFGLAQIAIEGRTGYWMPFFRIQGELIVKLLTM